MNITRCAEQSIIQNIYLIGSKNTKKTSQKKSFTMTCDHLICLCINILLKINDNSNSIAKRTKIYLLLS